MSFVKDWVGSVEQAYRAGRPVAFFFDYDGTLSPIVAHPSLAVLSETVREHLRELTSHERVSVGVISGRALDDVLNMIRLPDVFYAGSCGSELDLQGDRWQYPLSLEAQTQFQAVLAELRAVVPDFPGVWIEEKPLGFAVHYRAASPVIGASFQLAFREMITRFSGLHTLNICEAFEVSPTEAWNKGTAVQFILQKLPTDVHPVYFGDSENDRPGMVSVRSVGGVTVAIGETAPDCAEYRLAHATDLHADLARMCESLSRHVERVMTTPDVGLTLTE